MLHSLSSWYHELICQCSVFTFLIEKKTNNNIEQNRTFIWLKTYTSHHHKHKIEDICLFHCLLAFLALLMNFNHYTDFLPLNVMHVYS